MGQHSGASRRFVTQPSEERSHFEITLLNNIYHVIPKQPVSALRRRGELISTVLDLVSANHPR